jgi:hypothetical protein
MYLRVIAGVALGCLLAGCVTTTPTHNLSQDAVRGLRLERVEVAVDPTAKLIWPSLAQDVFAAETARTGAPPPTEMPGTLTPQMMPEALARLRTQARKTLEPALQTRLAGAKPVVARVTVHYLYVPNLAGDLMVGVMFGANAVQSRLAASVDFVDARTGAAIVSYPKTGFQTQGGYKLNMGTSGMISHDPIERLFAGMGGQVAGWLSPG